MQLHKVSCNVLRELLTNCSMDSPKDDSLERIECDLLAEHSGARVVIRRSLITVYEALDIRAQARFEAIMKRWCDDPSQLTEQMFNGNEGRTPRLKVMLQAFKNNSSKTRLYGFPFTVAEKKTFIIVDADTAKKQNKADPNILKRARTRIDDFLEKYADKEK